MQPPDNLVPKTVYITTKSGVRWTVSVYRSTECQDAEIAARQVIEEIKAGKYEIEVTEWHVPNDN